MNKEELLKQFLFKEFHFAGRFVSTTGTVMPVYPDVRSVYSYPDKYKIILEALVEELNNWPEEFSAIISPATAGIGWGFGSAIALNKRFGYLRAEPKSIQLKKQLEGNFEKNERVVIVDDALSSSKTKKQSIEILEEAGLKVVGILVFFDAWFSNNIDPLIFEKRSWFTGYNYQYLFTWKDLIDYYRRVNYWSSEFCDLVIEVIENFTTWQNFAENWQRFKDLALKEKNITIHDSLKDI